MGPGMGITQTHELSGGRVLVAEDELLIALDIGSILSDAGAEVVGPAMTVASAVALVRTTPLSAATLDVRLGRETTEEIAFALSERRIPFIFYTGQSLTARMSEHWPDVPVVTKPAARATIIATMKAVLEGKASAL